jgi:ABC-type Fe3+-hydroxamate transport system substrate-binding protein
LKNLILFLLLILNVFSCGGDEKRSLLTRQKESRRIVSLSPSITAQILDLEASNLLVGVTTYSPPLPHKVEIVGTLTSPNIEKILLLKPDTVVYSIEDAAVQRTEQLEAMGVKLISFRKNADYRAICENYRTLSRLLGREGLAEKKLALYDAELERLENMERQNIVRPSIAFFVSHEPMITISGRSFISGIINDAGGTNSYDCLEKAYPLVSAESILLLKPDIIISMIPGAEKFFHGLFEGYTTNQRDFLSSIYQINPDIIALYTPAAYVNSVRELIGIIALYNKKSAVE